MVVRLERLDDTLYAPKKYIIHKEKCEVREIGRHPVRS